VDLIRQSVPAGTEAIVVTAGGGGWGDPLERDPEKVRWDVLEGYVSLESARRDYGVVLQSGTLEIDRTATARLRNEMGADSADSS
jgi:N-methylhydantoinase B